MGTDWVGNWVRDFTQPLNEEFACCLKTEKEVVSMRAYCESSMPLIFSYFNKAYDENLKKNLSDREISNVLEVSRNSVARIRQISGSYNGEWEDFLMMTDDELYRFFYPDKFKPKCSYAPIDYAYVHKELSKVGITEILLWEEYCEKCK